MVMVQAPLEVDLPMTEGSGRNILGILALHVWIAAFLYLLVRTIWGNLAEKNVRGAHSEWRAKLAHEWTFCRQGSLDALPKNLRLASSSVRFAGGILGY